MNSGLIVCPKSAKCVDLVIRKRLEGPAEELLNQTLGLEDKLKFFWRPFSFC